MDEIGEIVEGPPLCCWHDIKQQYLGWTLEHCCHHGDYRWGCHFKWKKHGEFEHAPAADALDKLMNEANKELVNA